MYAPSPVLEVVRLLIIIIIIIIIITCHHCYTHQHLISLTWTQSPA
jgi:hypothetical protein